MFYKPKQLALLTALLNTILDNCLLICIIDIFSLSSAFCACHYVRSLLLHWEYKIYGHRGRDDLDLCVVVEGFGKCSIF